jgi:hypothetical protein
MVVWQYKYTHHAPAPSLVTITHTLVHYSLSFDTLSTPTLF